MNVLVAEDGEHSDVGRFSPRRHMLLQGPSSNHSSIGKCNLQRFWRRHLSWHHGWLAILGEKDKAAHITSKALWFMNFLKKSIPHV